MRSAVTFITIILVLGICINSLQCLRSFIRGRRFEQKHKTQHLLHRFLSPNITDKYYEQKLDHFDETITVTWKQRYWINDEYFEDKNGPVFLMIGGEGEENPIWMTNGQWVNYAKQFKALLLMLEHRYYGKSRPTDDMSTKNLVYLSSEQALADLASFTSYIYKSMNLTDNKLITFGGSYPGSLSAWFRLKYPHIVHGAVSSSAPMLALIDFRDYLVVVNNSLHLYHAECPKQIEQATKKIQELISTFEGRIKLQMLFSTCEPIIGQKDIINFYSTIAGNFEDAVQYNKDNRFSKGLNINELCDIMVDEEIGSPLERYAAVNDLVLKFENKTCLDASYDSFIEDMTDITWEGSAAVGGRQWTYQTCVEFGFFQSTTSNQQPFGQTIPVAFYIDQCKDIFGASFNTTLLDDAIYQTNTNYGALKYQGARVVFVNGEIDPWHSLGFYKNAPNQFTQAIFIKGTAHCADLYPSSDQDPPQLIRAREQIGNIIRNWLRQD